MTNISIASSLKTTSYDDMQMTRDKTVITGNIHCQYRFPKCVSSRLFWKWIFFSFSSKTITHTAHMDIHLTSIIQIYKRRLNSKTDDTTETTAEQSVGGPTTMQFSLHVQSTLS